MPTSARIATVCGPKRFGLHGQLCARAMKLYILIFAALSAPFLSMAHQWGSAPGVVIVGGRGMDYILDVRSVKSEGTQVTYRVVTVPTAPEYTATIVRYDGLYGVDCSARTWIEHRMVREYVGRPTTVRTDDVWRPLDDNTRRAMELETACEIAGLPTIRTWKGPQPYAIGAAPPGAALTPEPLLPPRAVTPPAALQPREVSNSRPKWSGTAFFLTTTGYLATNHHVVDQCGRLDLKIGSDWLAAEVAAVDDRSDLAVLKVGGGPYTPLTLSAAQPDLGAAIVVLGYPLISVLGSDLRVTTGVVSSVVGIKGDRRTLQISAPVQPGNSGGPIMDETGSVVAVAVARLSDKYRGENVNFGVKVALLRSLMEIHGIAPAKQVAPTRSLSAAEVVRRASTATVLIACY